MAELHTCMEIVRVEKPCLKIHSASSSSSSSSAGLTGMDRNYKKVNSVRKTGTQKDNIRKIKNRLSRLTCPLPPLSVFINKEKQLL